MSVADEILDLIETTGQKAPDMTQALKAIGGDMKAGIKKIGEFFYDQGKHEGFQAGKGAGEKRGFLKGSVMTLGLVALVQTGFYLYDRHKETQALKAHEEAGQEIVDAIEGTVPPEEDEVLSSQPQTVGESHLAEAEGQG